MLTVTVFESGVAQASLPVSWQTSKKLTGKDACATTIKNGCPVFGRQPLKEWFYAGNLLDIGADNSGHLHHIDSLTFLDITEVGDLAGLTGGVCVLEDG